MASGGTSSDDVELFVDTAALPAEVESWFKAQVTKITHRAAKDNQLTFDIDDVASLSMAVYVMAFGDGAFSLREEAAFLREWLQCKLRNVLDAKEEKGTTPEEGC